MVRYTAAMTSCMTVTRRVLQLIICRMIYRKVAKRYRAAVYGRMTGSGTIDSVLDGRSAVTRWAAVAHLPAAVMDRQQAASGAAVTACDGGSSGGSDVGIVGSGAAADTGAGAACVAPAWQPSSGAASESAAEGGMPPEITILDLWPTTGRCACLCQVFADDSDSAVRMQLS